MHFNEEEEDEEEKKKQPVPFAVVMLPDRVQVRPQSSNFLM